jgi:hypothetical protein
MPVAVALLFGALIGAVIAVVLVNRNRPGSTPTAVTEVPTRVAPAG